MAQRSTASAPGCRSWSRGPEADLFDISDDGRVALGWRLKLLVAAYPVLAMKWGMRRLALQTAIQTVLAEFDAADKATADKMNRIQQGSWDMGDPTLDVDEQTMRDTASVFDETGRGVSGNQAGPAISGAAGAMPALAVGAACGTVGFALTEQAKQLGSDVTVYAQKLRVAADRYERGDEEAAERIDFAGTAELPDAGEHPPVSDYEQALRDAGLLTGPVVPGSRYAQWLENASKNGVAPQTIVDIARTHNITPQSFDVLNGLQEVKDEDGKSFFILPSGTSKEDAKKAVVMTYILNAGTDYEAAEAGRDGVLGTADDVQNDFEETPYSAAEVQRIIDRQNANSWSYDQIFDKGGGIIGDDTQRHADGAGRAGDGHDRCPRRDDVR